MKLGLVVLIYTSHEENGELMWLSLREMGFDARTNFNPDNLGSSELKLHVNETRGVAEDDVFDHHHVDIVAVVDTEGGHEDDPSFLHSLKIVKALSGRLIPTILASAGLETARFTSFGDQSLQQDLATVLQKPFSMTTLARAIVNAWENPYSNRVLMKKALPDIEAEFGPLPDPERPPAPRSLKGQGPNNGLIQ